MDRLEKLREKPFEIEILLKDQLYKYVLALELPENFKEIRVFEEQLLVEGKPIYLREAAQVTLYGNSTKARISKAKLMSFQVDWHLVALPLIQEKSETDPLHIFKNWLSHTPFPV